MNARLRLAITVLPMSLCGCLPAFPNAIESTERPTLEPAAFFAGRTTGEGSLSRRFVAERTLHVEGTGRMEPGGLFRLDQTVTFDDGAIETRTWRLRRTAENEYRATLSDATGGVRAQANGNSFHVRYLLRQPLIYMDQWLYLQPDGRTVINRATVTVLGIPWARLDETITRSD
jgi:hypothetical protein